MITLKAPAKLNLYLEILNRRADGYHNLSSLFQMVGLYDELHFQETEQEDIHLSIAGLTLSVHPSNLVIRAASLLQAEMRVVGLPLKGAHIHLHKNIPVSAGMGGGSSDAAATLIGLNRLWSLNWSRETLAALGSRIGSDLPFFFYGPAAWVSGRGEIVKPTPPLTEGVFLLVHPDFAVSTAAVFRAYAQSHATEIENREIELTRETPPPNILSNMKKQPLMETILRHARNDLETVTLPAHPVLKAIKTSLASLGGQGVMMSGSGPTVFGYFKNTEAAQTAADHLKVAGHRISIAPILKQSPFEAFL